MTFIGSEKLVDDPLMVDGKFVRNVGSARTPPIYKYVYLKDGDKDVLNRMYLAGRVGFSMGLTAGIIHIAQFGRNPKWPTKYDPFIRIAFSCATGMATMALHAGAVSISSQLQGGRDLVRNWALGGAVAGAFVYSAVRKTPGRGYLSNVPAIVTVASALTKVAVVYDKPLQGPPVTAYGANGCNLYVGPRHVDTMNPYRRQEEHYMEKYL